MDDSITALRLENMDKEVNDEVAREEDKMGELEWGKSLQFLTVFTRRETNNHVKKCGKLHGKSTAKTIIVPNSFHQARNK